MNVWAVILAGGLGARFGSHKQFETLGQKKMVEYSIDVLAPLVSGTVLVVPDKLARQSVFSRIDTVAPAGQTRALSAREGVAAVPDSANFVLLHDASRPMISADLVGRVLKALEAGAQAAIPAIPLTDSIRSVTTGYADRDDFRLIQTPQGFPKRVLDDLYSSEMFTNGDALATQAADESSLVEKLGYEISLVEGDPDNIKVTYAKDIVTAEAISSAWK